MLDRTTLLRATAANHRAFFRRYATLGGGRVERVAEFELILDGPDAKLAFPSRGAHAAQRLDELIGRARSLGIRTMSCWALEEDPVLGTLLIARGFEWGWQPHWMARKITRLPRPTIEREVVRFEPGPALPQRGLPYADSRADPRQVRHLAVRQGGVTVGHAIVNPWRGFAGLYSMGVTETHQRRGIGRALTLAACRLARDLGCTHALLNATYEGELLYRTLGFQSFGRGQTWWRHPGPWPTSRQTRIVEAIGFGEIEMLAALRPSRHELERPIPGPGPPLAVAAVTGQAAAADWIRAKLGRK